MSRFQVGDVIRDVRDSFRSDIGIVIEIQDNRIYVKWLIYCKHTATLIEKRGNNVMFHDDGNLEKIVPTEDLKLKLYAELI